MKSIEFIELSDLCQWNEPDEINQILERDGLEPSDLIQNEGELFKIAAIKGFPEVLVVLIDHYKKSNLISDNISDTNKNLDQFYKTKSAELKLCEILEDIVNMGTILDDRIKEIIMPYIHLHDHDSTDSYQDIDSDIEYMLSNAGEMLEIGERDILGNLDYTADNF